MSKKRQNNTKSPTSISGSFVSAFRCSLISLALALILCVGASAASLLFSDPDALVLPLSFGILYLSSFVSGFMCKRQTNESPLLCALFSGGLLMLIFMLISLFFPADMSRGYSFWLSFILHALMLLFSFLGAQAGRHKAKRKIRR